MISMSENIQYEESFTPKRLLVDRPSSPVGLLIVGLLCPAWPVDKIRYRKPIDKSLSIDKVILIYIDCIDQSMKFDTQHFFFLKWVDFYRFYRQTKNLFWKNEKNALALFILVSHFVWKKETDWRMLIINQYFKSSERDQWFSKNKIVVGKPV